MMSKVIKLKKQAEAKIVVAITNALHWCLGRDGTGRCFSVVTLLYARVQ